VRILVLGDSSSAGIGSGIDVYPYRLYCRLEKSGPVEIQNHSAPGFTSADAARYFKIRLSRDHWDAVVVYLGNNEGGPGAHKGRYHSFLDTLGLRRRRSAPYLPAKTGPHQDFYLLRDEPQPVRGPVTTPAEFSYNLSQIINFAKARGTQVALVSPFANRAYPASAGPSLSPFFKIIGSPSTIGDLVTADGDTATLIRDAICAQEQRHYEIAAHKYNAVLSNRGSPPWLLALASNNLAVLLHHAGRSRDAERMFTSQALARHTFSSIATYNLARLLHEKGVYAEADEWFGLATEQDTYLYRIKDAYRDAIACTAAASGAHLLDLAAILTHDMFVDYCHPTAQAHDEIASALNELLSRMAAMPSKGWPESSRYLNYYPSPNAFEYCNDNLLDYYQIAPPASAETLETETAQITMALQRLREQKPSRAVRCLSANSALQHAIIEALTCVTRHPIITCVDDLCRWPVRSCCEFGRLPEHYIYRLLSCYLEWAHAHGISCLLGDDDIEGQSDLRLRYRRLMIGRTGGDSETHVNVDEGYRRRLRQRVLEACQDEDLFRDSRAERVMTVLRWYTREAFRYGTQSRVSMLYPMAAFDSIAEALRVWMVMARFHGDQSDERMIQSLYSWLRGLERIHSHYAARFLCQRYSASDQESILFRRELLRWKDTLSRISLAC
jgi:lysophospholipase L1-like esterase